MSSSIQIAHIQIPTPSFYRPDAIPVAQPAVSKHSKSFNGEPGLAGFTGAKDDASGGENWSYKSCKAPVKSSPPTNQHPFFTGRMPFLSPNQQFQSIEGKISHSMDLLTPSSPGAFQLCL